MCTRYSLRSAPEEVRGLLDYIEQPNFPPRDEVRPTDPIAIVRGEPNGSRHFALVRWGFIPSWAKEMGQPLMNARAETVYEKPSFKNAIRRRRCLVPADGFYEWQDVGGRVKQPWQLHRPGNAPFAFAGIWEHWLAPNGSELETAAILTGEARQPLSAITERSPLVIAPEHYARWLSPDEQVHDLLRAPPDDFWMMTRIAPLRAAKVKSSAQENLF